MQVELLDQKKAADYIGIKPDTFKKWRSRKVNAIPYRKIGKKIEFLKSDLDKFIESKIRK